MSHFLGLKTCHRPVTIVCALTLISVLSAFPSFAQTSHHADTTSVPANVIDGSRTPDLIPDATAFRLFLRSIAEAPNAPEFNRLRARAKIRAAGLNETDTAAVLIAAIAFHVDMTIIDNAVAEIQRRIAPGQRLSPSDAAALTQLQRDADALVATAQNKIKSVLSTDGAVALKAHMQHIKQRTTLAPAPTMQ